MTAAIVNHLKYVTIGVTYLPLGDIAILSMVGNNKILLVTSVALLQLLKNEVLCKYLWNVHISIISHFGAPLRISSCE